jgi:hypothetical protein
MASNKLPQSRSALLDLADDMIDGLHDHGTRLKVLQWTETKLTPLLAATRISKTAHDAASAAEDAVTSQRKTANSNAKAFIATAKRMLEDELGHSPNRAWEDAGWPSGTTEAPNTIEDRKKLLDKLTPWLATHPDREVPQKNFTHSAAVAILTALSAAIQGLNPAVGNRVAATAADLAAENALRNGMSGLARELGSLLNADSPDWYYFGLVPPAKAEAPAPPEHLTARQAGPSTVVVGCDRGPRATRYLFTLQVTGRDSAAIEQDPRHDPTITLENLPAGAEVKLTVKTQNGAGDSAVVGPVVVKLM